MLNAENLQVIGKQATPSMLSEYSYFMPQSNVLSTEADLLSTIDPNLARAKSSLGN